MRLIDADALIAEMKEYRTEQEKEQMYSGDRGICVTWNDAVFFIKNAPTIETEPSQVARDIATIIENEKDMRVIGERKRGKWDTVIITIASGHKYGYYACSSCGIASDSEFDFCPNCGADMRDPE